jgi:hypothetical protein
MNDDTLVISSAWAIDDIIDAHDLDHRRAMALAAIVSCWSESPAEALYHLRRLRANSGLMLSGASVYPLDPDAARKMTGEAVADNFGIENVNLRDALIHLIPNGDVMTQSVHGFTDDVDTAIGALEEFLASGEGAE